MKKNQIILGDSIKEMKKIKDHSVDLIFADPPYILILMDTLYIPDQTTAQPTPEPTPTPIPTPTPRVTPTPIPDYVGAYIYTDPSCSNLYVGWEPGGGSQLEPQQWHIEIEVDSYLGLAVVEETFPTPIASYPANHTFSVTEFYANETIWPSGPGSNGRAVAVITVSYQDGGVLRSPAGYQVLLNNCGNQLAPAP